MMVSCAIFSPGSRAVVMDDLSNAELRALLAERDATIRAQQQTIDELQQLVKALANEVALLKRSLLGRRRERFDDPRQGSLFDAQWIGSEADAPEEAASGDEDLKEADEEESPPQAFCDRTVTACRLKRPEIPVISAT